jgi:hypothetical protein
MSIEAPSAKTTIDADGVPLYLYDVVELLKTTRTTFNGTVDVETVSAGTTAIIIEVYTNPPGAELDCQLGDGEFTFTVAGGADLRLVRRGEEKLNHA